MTTRTSSLSTLDLIISLSRYWKGYGISDQKGEDVEEPEAEIRFGLAQYYVPMINGAVGWLPKVEEAITSSVPEEFDEEENEGQWLDGDSAYNAINFLQNTADLLPGEPSIYGTPAGDFVAEFEDAVARLTSIVSSHRTLLVGYCRANPQEQVQKIIPRGSNSVREEFREFSKRLAAIHVEALGSAR